MASGPAVRVGRVYHEAVPHDGARVLVDRLWPRSLSKERAAPDEWCKQVAPSNALRKCYGHDPSLFEEFARPTGPSWQNPNAPTPSPTCAAWPNREP